MVSPRCFGCPFFSLAMAGQPGHLLAGTGKPTSCPNGPTPTESQDVIFVTLMPVRGSFVVIEITSFWPRVY
jgi:hypothetical protein